MSQSDVGRARSPLVLLLFFAVCYGVAATGSQFLPGTWYASLAKPAWTPPSVLFGPVWAFLYTVMAIAGWRLWRVYHPLRPLALGLFALQLIFNALWSWLFFGRWLMVIALVDIGLLWASLLALTAVAFRVDRWAGILLVPYAIWVSYAFALHGAIAWLNR